jgi:hypothetical protein
MYSRCIWCTADLGANETLEHFPVGRRIAFDAAKGRLWVVCRKCERWNLTPLEERWEAIEAAERRYRDTKKRVATDHIGLAKVDDGLELVRIGAPQRPEFVAWRYGDQFRRRHQRALVVTSAIGVIGVMSISQPLLGISGLASTAGMLNVGRMLIEWRYHRRIRVHVTDGVGQRVSMRRSQLARVRVAPSETETGWELRMHRAMPDLVRLPDGRLVDETTQPDIVMHGEVATQALTTIVPYINAGGGKDALVREAERTLTEAGDGQGMLALAKKLYRDDEEAKGTTRHVPLSVVSLPPAVRLALEMGLHEEEERAVIEGELTLLERRWREAEEIAGIADNMFLPTNTEDRLMALRAEGPGHRDAE